MGRPPRNQFVDPRRVESPARMTVADQEPVEQDALMKEADSEIPAFKTTMVDPAVLALMGLKDSDLETALMKPTPAPSEDDLIAGYALVSDIATPDDRVTKNLMRLPPVPSRPWFDMEDAPRDGTLLEAKADDGTEFMVIYRRTSRFNASASRWEPVGFWSDHMSRQPVKVQPVGWRMAQGFVAPGQVVA